MPAPMDPFEVELDELEKVATQHLPSIADALRASGGVLLAHEGLEGPGQFQPVYAFEGAYAHYTDSVGNRQRVGCERIDATASALRDTVTVYRRADGRK